MSLILRRFARIDALRFRLHRWFRPDRATAWILAVAWVAGLAGPVPAAITSLSVLPTAMSPNGDGVQDAVRIRWTATTPPAGLRVTVAHSNTGTVVRTFLPGPRPAGVDSLVWDGLNDSSAPVADANYLVRLLELDAAGTPLDPPGSVASLLLDTAAPPPPFFDSAWDGRDTTVAKVRIGGIADDADSARIFVGGLPALVVHVPQPDSTFEAEVPLAEGTNSIAIQSFDRSGNRSLLSPAITITYRNTADIVAFAARPFLSSPNGDGVLDSVVAQVRLDAPTTRLLIQVHPSNPPLVGTRMDSVNTVAKVFDGPSAAGDFLFEWDARDSTGTRVADGNWYFSARAESADVAGMPIEAARFSIALFTIDTTAPAVPVLSPTPPDSTTRNFFEFRGQSPGAAASDSVYVWRGTTIVQRASGASWSARVTLVLGDNTFTFQGVDPAGNRSAMSAPVTIVYHEPIGFHAPELFRATDVFDVNVTRTARSVRLDLYDLGGRLVRTLLVSQPGQRFELPWNLLDERGVTVGNGPYVARLTVTFDDGVVETKSGAIVVAK